MGRLLSKIVLTGGPCAGKTTALAKIEEDLTEKGYRVFVVSESATELIKGGIRPFGDKSIELLEFQNLILQYQLGKEKIYEQASRSLSNTEKCVIIYDRGVIDNKAYISSNEFAGLLEKNNMHELNLMDNYDMVLHLVTAADGKEEYYTLSNNVARTETVEEAKELDRRTANAWAGHSNLRIIDNSTGFEEKINRVLDEINNWLGNPITIRKQKKYTVDLTKFDISFLNDGSCTRIDIEQIYLKNYENSDYERRLRKRTYQGQSTYYLTVQKKGPKGESKIVTDEKITEKENQKLLALYEEESRISKTRYSFTHNNQYFKLDIFNDINLALLEVESTKENQIISVPKHIKIIDDVTDNPDYYNYNLAVSRMAKVALKGN
jgi:CYTH domain-containing protein/thymidylate kinase